MYQSPIEMIVKDIQLKQEEGIFKAIQECKVSVDREELLKALQYDREQYKKGYADRDAEIVRCKDCNWCHKAVFAKYWNGEEIERCYCDIHKRYTSDDYYCADGERRENEQIH